MCIRDRYVYGAGGGAHDLRDFFGCPAGFDQGSDPHLPRGCLLYTSDAADDLPCVDLGGRRIIKKKNTLTTVDLVIRYVEV